jgi:nitrogenase iron protein NifH
LKREGFSKIRCVEAGDPKPDIAYAGCGIITSIGLLERLCAYAEDLDNVFYDVLGDLVCGGFAISLERESSWRSA